MLQITPNDATEQHRGYAAETARLINIDTGFSVKVSVNSIHSQLKGQLGRCYAEMEKCLSITMASIPASPPSAAARPCPTFPAHSLP